ncbi:MAG: hypothetical protein P9M14_08750 [Candidatus Alcyoniella australis]|nr:hypothetical protein [Candidatus Alcyoniella australis]
MGLWGKRFIKGEREKGSNESSIRRKKEAGTGEDKQPTITAFTAWQFDESCLKGKYGACTGLIADNVEIIFTGGESLSLMVHAWIVCHSSYNYKITEDMITAGEHVIQTSSVISFPQAWFQVPLPPAESMTDSDVATQIAEENGGYVISGGGMFGSTGIFILNMRIIDGRKAPLWLMPHRYQDYFIRAIDAQQGTIVYPDVSDQSGMLFTSQRPKAFG